MLTLSNIHLIKDQAMREMMLELKQKLNGDLFLKSDLKLMEVSVPSATANLRVRHNLGFRPTDVIVTFDSGGGTLTFNYNLFDSDYIDITTAGGPVNVRFLIGKIRG